MSRCHSGDSEVLVAGAPRRPRPDLRVRGDGGGRPRAPSPRVRPSVLPLAVLLGRGPPTRSNRSRPSCVTRRSHRRVRQARKDDRATVREGRHLRAKLSKRRIRFSAASSAFFSCSRAPHQVPHDTNAEDVGSGKRQAFSAKNVLSSSSISSGQPGSRLEHGPVVRIVAAARTFAMPPGELGGELRAVSVAFDAVHGSNQSRGRAG